MKRLRIVVYRYVLPLVPIPVFWILFWSSGLGSSLVDVLTPIMFFAAIIGVAVAISCYTDCLSQKRVVVLIDLLGFVIWLLWAYWLLWGEGSYLDLDPTSTSSVLRILAWPMTIFGLFLERFDYSSLSVALAVLTLTIVLILAPSAMLSIWGLAALRRMRSRSFRIASAVP